MRIHDISVTVSPRLAVWPGDPPVYLEREGKIEEGENSNNSRLNIGVHTGTHVDAPFHFLMDGSRMDDMPLDVLIGPAEVIRVPDEVGVVTAAVLKEVGIPAGTTRLLLKTRNSRLWTAQPGKFDTSFVGISEDAAQELVDEGVRLVAIDYLSIAPYKQSRPTHEVLLKAGVVIIEGVDLSSVEPGSYTLYCLPLKLGGAEGAPARAVLISA